MKGTQMRTEAVYSELAIAREAVAITCIWQRLSTDREVAKLHS